MINNLEDGIASLTNRALRIEDLCLSQPLSQATAKADHLSKSLIETAAQKTADAAARARNVLVRGLSYSTGDPVTTANNLIAPLWAIHPHIRVTSAAWFFRKNPLVQRPLLITFATAAQRAAVLHAKRLITDQSPIQITPDRPVSLRTLKDPRHAPSLCVPLPTLNTDVNATEGTSPLSTPALMSPYATQSMIARPSNALPQEGGVPPSSSLSPPTSTQSMIASSSNALSQEGGVPPSSSLSPPTSTPLNPLNDELLTRDSPPVSLQLNSSPILTSPPSIHTAPPAPEAAPLRQLQKRTKSPELKHGLSRSRPHPNSVVSKNGRVRAPNRRPPNPTRIPAPKTHRQLNTPVPLLSIQTHPPYPCNQPLGLSTQHPPHFGQVAPYPPLDLRHLYPYLLPIVAHLAQLSTHIPQLTRHYPPLPIPMSHHY